MIEMPMEIYHHTQAFLLESGEVLPEFQLAYQSWGERAPDDANVVWVCHALTANADAEDWWPGMIGEGCLLDPARHYIICANMLGSCYGSTNALSPRPGSQEPYFHDFPLLTNRDIVRAFDLLRLHLGISRIHLITGGSMGGQQALEWAVMRPDLIEHLVPIATNAQHSPWGIAFNETQRMSIQADSSWTRAHPEAGLEGLRAARAAALLSYRGYETYQRTQMEETGSLLDDFRASSYQRYQGEKLVRRFHAFAYWTLSKAMDSHHLGRQRGGLEPALGSIQARTLVIGISSDILFPVAEQRLLARHIANARYVEIDSPYGHDGFLIEVSAISREIATFLQDAKLSRVQH